MVPTQSGPKVAQRRVRRQPCIKLYIYITFALRRAKPAPDPAPVPRAAPKAVPEPPDESSSRNSICSALVICEGLVISRMSNSICQHSPP
jgi:hypothetical protein